MDDFTLEITLENPADYFVSMTSMSAFMPVREDLVENMAMSSAEVPINRFTMDRSL